MRVQQLTTYLAASCPIAHDIMICVLDRAGQQRPPAPERRVICVVLEESRRGTRLKHGFQLLDMLEICQILLISLSFCGLSYCGLRIVLLARASLAQLAGWGTVALEGCVRLNGSWLDEAVCAWSLLSWNSAHRPPPGERGASASCTCRGAAILNGLIRAVGVLWGTLFSASPLLTPRRL
jgi:hypothetical protein